MVVGEHEEIEAGSANGIGKLSRGTEFRVTRIGFTGQCCFEIDHSDIGGLQYGSNKRVAGIEFAQTGRIAQSSFILRHVHHGIAGNPEGYRVGFCHRRHFA
ncbi:hypothetical protein SDC9_77053 [bioreactor metagenome]|uniref:Uncharacterized protein n=1 Tax=bioreactor metagenome TaxID=1076179 RepID=A0A644YVL8_9ZZZZ